MLMVSLIDGSNQRRLVLEEKLITHWDAKLEGVQQHAEHKCVRRG